MLDSNSTFSKQPLWFSLAEQIIQKIFLGFLFVFAGGIPPPLLDLYFEGGKIDFLLETKTTKVSYSHLESFQLLCFYTESRIQFILLNPTVSQV